MFPGAGRKFTREPSDGPPTAHQITMADINRDSNSDDDINDHAEVRPAVRQKIHIRNNKERMLAEMKTKHRKERQQLIEEAEAKQLSLKENIEKLQALNAPGADTDSSTDCEKTMDNNIFLSPAVLEPDVDEAPAVAVDPKPVPEHLTGMGGDHHTEHPKYRGVEPKLKWTTDRMSVDNLVERWNAEAVNSERQNLTKEQKECNRVFAEIQLSPNPKSLHGTKCIWKLKTETVLPKGKTHDAPSMAYLFATLRISRILKAQLAPGATAHNAFDKYPVVSSTPHLNEPGNEVLIDQKVPEDKITFQLQLNIGGVFQGLPPL